jgi:hypothetical protein
MRHREPSFPSGGKPTAVTVLDVNFIIRESTAIRCHRLVMIGNAWKHFPKNRWKT